MREDDEEFFKENALVFFCVGRRVGFSDWELAGDNLRGF